MIRLRYDTTIGGVRHGKGSLLHLDPTTEAELLMRGDADTNTGINAEIYSRNASGEIIGLQGDNGKVIGLQIHPYYHFHGFAGNQFAGDSKFFDLTGINHGIRGANLSDAQMFADSGYVSTVDPAPGATDSAIRIPAINFDYAGGEKLIVWWLGAGIPEGADVPVMGDGYGTGSVQHGWRLRMKADGKFDLALWGDIQENSGPSHTVVFDAALHSLAFAFDGTARAHGMWVDEIHHASFGSSLASFGGGAVIDTRSSNTVNVGASRPASASTTDGAAIKTRALVLIRLPAAYSMPSVATLSMLFGQLRANPAKLILASAF